MEAPRNIGHEQRYTDGRGLLLVSCGPLAETASCGPVVNHNTDGTVLF